MTDGNDTEKDLGKLGEQESRRRDILPTWPEREIFTGDPGASRGVETNQTPKGKPDEPSELLSRHSPRSRRGHSRNTSRQGQSSSASSWRALKSLDICSFNAGAESHFVLWLARKIESEEFGAVSVGWVLNNAAFELDVSVETIKRYLGKHTADLAEFRSDGKIVTLRD